MSLRDQVKRTLARTEPSPEEAARELDTIVKRARGASRTRARVVFVLAPVALAAVLFLVLRRPPPTPQPQPPPKVAAGGIHLFLHVDGEPLELAVTLDLTQNGEH